MRDAHRELRGLIADFLTWWAFRLDPERFITPCPYCQGLGRRCWTCARRERRTYTGLTLMLFDDAGNAQASAEWQEAAERICALLGAGQTTNTAWDYARAHRILDAMFAASSEQGERPPR